MAGKALKLFLLIISIAYISFGSFTAVHAQDQTPSDITYDEPEETDFC